MKWSSLPRIHHWLREHGVTQVTFCLVLWCFPHHAALNSLPATCASKMPAAVFSTWVLVGVCYCSDQSAVYPLAQYRNRLKQLPHLYTASGYFRDNCRVINKWSCTGLSGVETNWSCDPDGVYFWMLKVQYESRKSMGILPLTLVRAELFVTLSTCLELMCLCFTL